MRTFGNEDKTKVVIEKIEVEIVQMIIDFAYQNFGAANLEARAYELFDASHKFGMETLRVSRYAAHKQDGSLGL